MDNERAGELIAIVDREGGCSYVSPLGRRILGYGNGELRGLSRKECMSLVFPEDRHSYADCLNMALAGGVIQSTFRIRAKDGSYRWIDLLMEPCIQRDGRIPQVRLAGRDVTDYKVLEQQLVYQALHDPLTYLPNRTLFLDRVERALSRARRWQHTTAILSVDLKRLKAINESRGYAVGDRILVAVGRRLEESVRGEGTVARIGGDEFAVLLEEVLDGSDAIHVAERITSALTEPFLLDGEELCVSASLGIVLSETGGEQPEVLLRDALAAAVEAQWQDGCSYALFDSAMQRRLHDRIRLEQDLRHALERDELLLHYQPICHLRSGRMVGVEALLRWQHPEDGLVMPARFIPVAEATGLILPVGSWVLKEACRQVRAWQSAHPMEPPLYVSVNLSVRQIRQPDLVCAVRSALETTGLSPDCLHLELTESTLLQDDQQSLRVLRDLRSMGVQVVIDDFGTGYSSLSYLRRLPVSHLKIDRAFVSGLDSGSEEAEAVVQVILDMARAFKLKATAEGIESAVQLERLQSMGCEMGQGFIFAKPMPSLELEAYLAERRSRA